MFGEALSVRKLIRRLEFDVRSGTKPKRRCRYAVERTWPRPDQRRGVVKSLASSSPDNRPHSQSQFFFCSAAILDASWSIL